MNRLQSMFINNVLSKNYIPNKYRIRILQKCGFNIQKNVQIRSNCYFDTNRFSIGSNSFINKFCQFHDGGYGESIIIGNNCMIAMGVLFSAVSHQIGNSEKRAGRTFTKSIIVGDGSWIGANAVIIPGVTIGKGCVIAAGSVVISDTDDNCLYAGNPAKKIKELY